jgi:drug/metabolite transporter (DMT)-like permease
MISTNTAYLALAGSLMGMAASQLLIKSRFENLGIGAALDQGAQSVAALLLSDLACWCAGGLIVAAAALWYLAMIRLPIHMMMPMSAVIAPITAIGAYFILGETITLQKAMAIVAIASSVAWLGSMSS